MVLVEKNEYFEYICTGSRSLVSNEHFDDISISYSTLIRSHANNRVECINGTLEKILANENLVMIRNNKNNEPEYMEYDYLVICTGSQYNEPIKDGDVRILDQRKSKLALEQEAIKRADSILVVGAGPVGVEVMSELLHMNKLANANNSISESIKKKKLTLLTRSDTVLPHFNRKA